MAELDVSHRSDVINDLDNFAPVYPEGLRSRRWYINNSNELVTYMDAIGLKKIRRR